MSTTPPVIAAATAYRDAEGVPLLLRALRTQTTIPHRMVLIDNSPDKPCDRAPNPQRIHSSV
jgi:hypothetical protein